jgi:hypothetical protein
MMSPHSIFLPSACDSCVSSSCSSSSWEEDDGWDRVACGKDNKEDYNATYRYVEEEDASQAGATEYYDRDDSTLIVQDQSSRKMAKLSFMLDDVLYLARVGDNAACKNIYKLPKGISKSDIHVLKVDIDERARGKSLHLVEGVQTAITEDLRLVYSAASHQDAKFTLATVIVLLTDGSLAHTFWDTEGVAGLAEIGVVWRLFETDTLKVYGGGLVVQKKMSGMVSWMSLTTRAKCVC